MNGYFRVVQKNGFCGIELNPPTDGGEPINREELLEYLSIKNFTYDVKVLGQLLLNLEEKVVFPTATKFQFLEGEFVKVAITPDNMNVVVRLIPCFEGANPMTKTEFLREFSSRGICFGIDDKAVDEFLEKRPYCTSVILAKGQPPVQGTDAKIEYYFNTDPRVKPTLNEDGSVDFFNLNTISHCQEGDLLARLYPAVPGKPGKNVKGEVLKPRDVKYANLRYERNAVVNEEKTELRAGVSGHVNLIEGKVFISNVFTVENVDNSVGNIDYDGSVVVNGNVCENFTVKAKGNVTVKGVVEGATIEAGGNLVIVRGINGMNKGVFKAEGNIVSKFIENATVTAGGYICSESIMHSTVVAGTDITVNGKRGFIAGGKATASNCVEAKVLGSNMGADTIIEVGIDASTKLRLQQLHKEVIEINKQLQMVRPVIEGAKQKLKAGVKMSRDQLIQIQKLVEINTTQTEKLESHMAELEKYESTDSETKGQVIVNGEVYPGTKICIGDVSTTVKNGVKYCRFIKEGGDVRMVAMY